MIHIKETYVDISENCISGESEVYETFTDSVGELFKHLQREFGRCISAIYIDRTDGSAKKVGWVFQKKRQYTDCNDRYMQETWIELHKSEPRKTIEYNLLEI